MPTLGAVDDLRTSAADQHARQELIKEFVSNQLQQGIDYGQIDIKGRASKPTLFKPGMEKIFALFNIVSELEKDEDTLSMITTKDVVAYRCRLYKGGQFVGEGRGACAVSEKARVNDAIKIAEKRARMDACLNLGFSEYFTQDLDDWEKDPAVPAAGQPAQEPEYKKTEYVAETLIIEGREEKRAKSGNPYLELATHLGKAIAFKNTMDRFEVGKMYRVEGWWETKGDKRTFIITSPASGIYEVTAEAETEAAPF